MYRKRFGLLGHPLPKDAQGKTFCELGPAHQRLRRAFTRLLDQPGLAVLTGEAGVGKTAALRNLCTELPKPDYQVLYLCDTAVSPLDLYRTLAAELGIRPSHRRAQLWYDIKQALVHLKDERHTSAIVVLDEAQHLSERFLVDRRNASIGWSLAGSPADNAVAASKTRPWANTKRWIIDFPLIPA